MDQDSKEHNLEINPSTEIRFKGPFTTVVTSHLQLRNGGIKTLCYKIMTTAPKMYCVRPNSGLIEVGKHVDISIGLQPFDNSASDKVKHTFLIQSVIADENNLENFKQLWKTIDKELIREIKLKCSFDQDQIFTMNSANVIIEGVSVNIISTVHENFFCLLCFNVLKDPYQAPCGCRFCSLCIADYLKTNAKICPGKTEDCLEMQLNFEKDIRPNVLAKREINKLILKCPFYACDIECELHNMKKHMEMCSLFEMICPTCYETVIRKEYNSHISDACLESLASCASCNFISKRKHLEKEHNNYEHENLCEKYVNFCPNKCGEEKKVVWKEHRKMCSNTVVSCPFNILGCSSNNTTLTQMSQHIINNGFDHSKILLKHIDNLNNNLEHTNNEQKSIRNDISATTKQLKDNHLTELQCQNNKIEAINTSVEKVKQTNLILSNEIRENKKVGTEIFNQKTLHNLSMDRLQNSIDMMKNEMESMKTKQDSVLEELKNLTIENGLLKKELSEVKNSKEILDENLQKKIIVLTWKIDEFSKIHYLTSPSFYIGPMGYKMELKLEKKVKGYLSLYACLLSGENDDYLACSFRKKITIRIVDQDSLGRDYDKIIPFDAKSGNASERKYSNLIVQYGFPNFISYEELRSNSYFLENNRLWIHCFVEELSP